MQNESFFVDKTEKSDGYVKQGFRVSIGNVGSPEEDTLNPPCLAVEESASMYYLQQVVYESERKLPSTRRHGRTTVTAQRRWRQSNNCQPFPSRSFQGGARVGGYFRGCYGF